MAPNDCLDVRRHYSTPPVPLDVIDEADFDADGDDHGSIDRLMAATDQGWDVEEQVLTLQKAAASQPTTKSDPFGYSRPARVPLPAPVASRP